ncbi:MAG: phosphoserine phosphatase SerB [Rhodobacteraceae bacterium]|nr:phosphoserine phosphatase SerB [Paracoccaceae bacterium]
MYVATLMAPHGGRKIGSDVVQTLRAGLNATSVRVLAAAQAYDFVMDRPVAGFDGFWRALQRMGFDLTCQPVQNRRKRVLLADMDSTMIVQECIDELAAEAGVAARVADITARAMAGEMDFETALRARVGLLQGLPVGAIDKVLAERISTAPGARELVATMRANGAYCALVSGGFTAFTAAIAGKLGFHEHRANRLLAAGGKLTGAPDTPILGRQAKVDALLDICATHNLVPADVLAIGDGANDLGMLRRAGSGVAVHAKPVVAARVSLRLNHTDLRGALWLQGYRAEEVISRVRPGRSADQARPLPPDRDHSKRSSRP